MYDVLEWESWSILFHLLDSELIYGDFAMSNVTMSVKTIAYGGNTLLPCRNHCMGLADLERDDLRIHQTPAIFRHNTAPPASSIRGSDLLLLTISSLTGPHPFF